MTGTPDTRPPPTYDRPGGPWDQGTLADLAPPAVVDPSDGTSLTSEQVLDRADRLAATLADRDVGPGSVVAWQLPNRWEALVAFHACWRLGAVAFPVHHRGGAARRESLLRRAGVQVLLVAHDLDPPDGAVVVRGPGDALAAALQREPRPPAAPDGADRAVTLATSGSTGQPKLVHHAHRGLAGKAYTMLGAHGLTAGDVVLMPAPMAHVSGLLNGVLLPGRAGMTTVLMDRWDPGHALDLIETHEVTFMIGPPTFFVDLQTAPGFTPERVSSLRLISSGGAGVTPAFVASATETFGAYVKRTYGSTEAPTVTTAHAGDPPERARTTDGRPTTDVELRTVDPTTGRDVGSGEQGELLVRGPELFTGYDAGTETPAFDADGWFHTGDLARIDARGWLTIVGRVKDTIIRGGENISPAAVEAVCAALPGVRQCAVLGVPDDRLGERVGLVVEADEAPELGAVQAACEQAGLERFMWPERVLRLDALPVLDAGKPDRRALVELLAAGDP